MKHTSSFTIHLIISWAVSLWYVIGRVPDFTHLCHTAGDYVTMACIMAFCATLFAMILIVPVAWTLSFITWVLRKTKLFRNFYL